MSRLAGKASNFATSRWRGKPLAKIVPDRPDGPPKRAVFAARRKEYWKWRTLSNEEVKAMKEAEYDETLEDLHGL